MPQLLPSLKKPNRYAFGSQLGKKKKHVCASFAAPDNKFDDELMIFIKILLNYIEYSFRFKKKSQTISADYEL